MQERMKVLVINIKRLVTAFHFKLQVFILRPVTVESCRLFCLILNILDMTELTRKETMTSKEVAELTGKQHSNVMRDIRSLLEQGVSQCNFELSSYKQNQPNGGVKDVPMYVLTKKGCLILASGYDAVLREKIINRWEELETKQRQAKVALPQTYLEALKALVAAEEEKQRVIEDNKRLSEDVSHKEDVIIGLVNNIDLATKRQRITQIVRYKSKLYKERYKMLYKEFELKYHVDLDKRITSANTQSIKPKIRNTMDYIDRVMGMIPQLYEIACKVFENDVEELKKEWDSTITRQ